MKPTVAIIPAAGLGTRFLPFTRTVSKELLPILNKPGLQYVLEELMLAGIKRVVIVTRDGKEDLRQFCQSGDTVYDSQISPQPQSLGDLKQILSDFEISWVIQNTPRGLGHAILCAASEIDDANILVALPDMIMDCPVSCSRQMLDAHQLSRRHFVATHREMRHPLSSYGVLDIGAQDGSILALKGLVEKPAPDKTPSNWVVSGRYLLPPEIFSILRDTEPDHRGEIQLTTALNVLLHKGQLDGFAFKGHVLDTGNVAGWLGVNIHFAQKEPAYAEILTSLITEMSGSNRT